MRHEVTVAIPAPAAVAWAVLTDLERWPSWTASMREVAINEPLAVGAIVRIRQPKLPTARWTVTALDPGRSFTWESTAPGLRTVAHHTVTPNGDATSRLVLSIEQTGAVGRMLGLVYGGLTRRYVQMEADGLAAEAARRAQGEQGQQHPGPSAAP